MKTDNFKDPQTSHIYLVGSGIASLSSAVYLIKDAKVPGKNIYILEQSGVLGGSLDGSGDPDKGYVIRGGRMHEAHFECYWDVLSNIPSLEDPNISVTRETKTLNKKVISKSKARLLKNGEIMDVSSYGLSKKNKADLLLLMATPEKVLGHTRIEDWFSHDFFASNFWLMWSTTFAFQKWSSLVEMRRYCNRFIHLFPVLNKLGGILRTKYNQYDSVIRPMVKWLTDEGVHFNLHTQVVDIDFDISADIKTATVIRYKNAHNIENEIILNANDCVFITNGSITESTDIGTMTTAPLLKDKESSGAWSLWEKIAKKDPDFGNPDVFCDNIDLQKWMSFTVTLKDSTFFDHMINFTGNTPGTGGLVTITDSNWMMSVVLALQPHFANQPKEVQVFWGYGLFPDRIGNFTKKKMSDCNGEDILHELFYHLKITDKMQHALKARKIICRPVMMPFIDSLFMPRKSGDRPDVIPKGSTNFAFLGQFAEAPRDCVFTVEYSVRCAQMAVFTFFETGRKVLPVYSSKYNPRVLYKAMKAMNR